jgi:hypothetical protein
MPPAVQALTKAMSSPMGQAYMKFMQHPAFMNYFNEVTGHPNRMTTLAVVAVWLVAILVFRAWRTSKVAGWRGRLWVRFYCGLIFTAGASFVIPSILMGEKYIKAFNGLIGAFLGK